MIEMDNQLDGNDSDTDFQLVDVPGGQNEDNQPLIEIV